MAACNECGSLVSPRARSCPHCGEPNPGRVSLNFGTITILGILVLALYSVGQEALLESPIGYRNFPSIAATLMVLGGVAFGFGGMAIMVNAKVLARKLMISGLIAVGVGAYLAFSGV